MIEFEVEEFQIDEIENGLKMLKLPELTEEEIKIIDPIVAPTSGLRIQIFDIIEENQYYLTSRKFFLFFGSTFTSSR